MAWYYHILSRQSAGKLNKEDRSRARQVPGYSATAGCMTPDSCALSFRAKMEKNRSNVKFLYNKLMKPLRRFLYTARRIKVCLPKCQFMGLNY